MGIRKSAGRCYRCRKWVALDDHEVVIDMTMAAMRPAWVKFHDSINHACERDECWDRLLASTRELLGSKPMCSKCWHVMNKVRPLSEGVIEMLEQGPAGFLPESAQFQWREADLRGAL